MAALSRMKPNTILPVHNHPELLEEGLLQFHITLNAAIQYDFSYLNLNGEWHRNKLGEAFVFDGSLDHFALNASPQDRIILYIEFYSQQHIALLNS